MGLSFKGVYQITNIVNDKIYVGSTTDSFRQRFSSHKSLLRRHIHPNIHLQRSWDKHGESNFTFTILECIDDSSKIIEREQYYIDELKPHYNISPTAGNTSGVPCSNKTKAKLSELLSGENNPMYGKQHSKESRNAMSKSRKGRFTAENHPRSKLTQELVDKIRLMISDKISYQKIADLLGIHKTTVYRIANNKTNWR